MFPFNTPESTATENGALEMPECYALEMISDWQSSSFCYTGSWDMTDWLEKNSSKIILHSNTAIYVQRVLYDLGYKNIVFTTNKKSVV